LKATEDTEEEEKKVFTPFLSLCPLWLPSGIQAHPNLTKMPGGYIFIFPALTGGGNREGQYKKSSIRPSGRFIHAGIGILSSVFFLPGHPAVRPMTPEHFLHGEKI
jgi:hypothetical protein